MKVICAHAFECALAGACKHSYPHAPADECNEECRGARCAPPLFYLTERDLRNALEDSNYPDIARGLTDEEFQSIAEDVFGELQRTWENDIYEVIQEALEFISVAREEDL